MQIDKAGMVGTLRDEPKLSESLHCTSWLERARRGGFGRSAFQFERKTSGEGPSADGQLRQGGIFLLFAPCRVVRLSEAYFRPRGAEAAFAVSVWSRRRISTSRSAYF